MPEPTCLAWRKSTYSGGASDKTSCVEVAPTDTGIALRDSKNRGDAVLSFPSGAWREFVTRL